MGLSTAAGCARRAVPVTLANTDLAGGTCRGFACGTAGTLNFMEDDGTIRTGFPAQAGYNPVQVKQFRTGGTASDIWALY